MGVTPVPRITLPALSIGTGVTLNLMLGIYFILLLVSNYLLKYESDSGT